MAIDTMDVVPVGGRVLVSGDKNKPYTRVSEEWMESHTGVRLRIKHFSGAVTAGLVEQVDDAAEVVRLTEQVAALTAQVADLTTENQRLAEDMVRADERARALEQQRSVLRKAWQEFMADG